MADNIFEHLTGAGFKTIAELEGITIMAGSKATANNTSTVVTVRLTYSKSTKRTFRFDAPEPQPGQAPSPIQSLYIDQSAFEYKAPPAITVTVAASE
jgi:hypothetical protein